MSLSTATARPTLPRPTEQSAMRFQNKVREVRAAFADQPTSMQMVIGGFRAIVTSVLGDIHPQAGITQDGLKRAILASSGDLRALIEPKIDDLMKLITTSTNASKTFSSADLQKFNAKVTRSLSQESSAEAVATATVPFPSEPHQISELLTRVSQTIINNSADTAAESKASTSDASVAASRLNSFIDRLNAKLSEPDHYTPMDIVKTEKALRAVQAHVEGSIELDPAKLQKHLGVLVAVDATASE